MSDIFEGLTEIELRVVHALSEKGMKTYEQVAKEIGMSKRQLQRYRKKAHIQKAVRQNVMDELSEDVPEIVASLRKNMRKGDFRSTELLAKMAGLVINQSEVKSTTTIEDNRFSDMTQEDIDAELQNVENELKVLEGGQK